MKKLGKLKLHDAAIMTDNEMKVVVGGNSASNCDYGSYGKSAYKCVLYNQDFPNVTTTVTVCADSQANAMTLGRAAFIATGYSSGNPILNTMQCNRS